jgi:hemerythrin superfamily protein
MSDIFEKLKADHDRHRDMLEAIASAAGDEERLKLFDAFRVEVTAHAAAEEQSLYANMLADPELQEDGRHSVAEHKEIDDLLGELQKADINSSDWTYKFNEMRHRYEHHIDEEEADMFPAAEERFPESKAEALGVKFEERKPAELAEAEASDNGSEKE